MVGPLVPLWRSHWRQCPLFDGGNLDVTNQSVSTTWGRRLLCTFSNSPSKTVRLCPHCIVDLFRSARLHRHLRFDIFLLLLVEDRVSFSKLLSLHSVFSWRPVLSLFLIFFSFRSTGDLLMNCSFIEMLAALVCQHKSVSCDIDRLLIATLHQASPLSSIVLINWQPFLLLYCQFNSLNSTAIVSTRHLLFFTPYIPYSFSNRTSKNFISIIISFLSCDITYFCWPSSFSCLRRRSPCSPFEIANKVEIIVEQFNITISEFISVPEVLRQCKQRQNFL